LLPSDMVDGLDMSLPATGALADEEPVDVRVFG
jgi:hypothetical protein